MTAGLSFDALVREGARKFLQTVLVIDNELVMERPPQEAAPRLGAKPPRPFSRPSPAAPAEPELSAEAQGAERGTRDVNAGTAPVATPAADNRPGPSELDAKVIMDTFLKNSLICGMHRPEKPDDLVSESTNAARRSDAVIVDWLLVGSDPTPAKEIIKGILRGDREDHGRLRLIVVYTSMPRIADVSKELLEYMPEMNLRDTGEGVLTGPETRIVVLNKLGTPTAVDPVSIEALPGRIIDEFARLSEGILSTFAVTAVAEIRRATHHVLAVFSSELDGAFLAHRCALKTPDDATEFALELLAGEFKGVVTRSGEATRILAAPPLEEWIARRAGADGMIRTDEVEIAVDIVKKFALDGEEAVVKSEKSQTHATVPGQPKPTTGLGKKKIVPRTVGQFFHNDFDHYRRAQHGFARLSQFKNEPYGRRAPRSGWKPTLSLGSLVVALDADSAPIPDRYLLCTQPRCDAVRIKGKRNFPFQIGQAVTHDAFNLVATRRNGEEDERLYVSVEMKPFDTVMVEFSATQDERVMAASDGPSFIFTAIDGARYLWLGDLRDLAAQRTAGTVAARLHDVGIDELEWLRLHAREKPPKSE